MLNKTKKLLLLINIDCFVKSLKSNQHLISNPEMEMEKE